MTSSIRFKNSGLKRLKGRLAEQNIVLTYTEEVAKFIADLGFKMRSGARPISRLIATHIENEISSIMLSNEGIGQIRISMQSGKPIFDTETALALSEK